MKRGVFQRLRGQFLTSFGNLFVVCHLAEFVLGCRFFPASAIFGVSVQCLPPTATIGARKHDPFFSPHGGMFEKFPVQTALSESGDPTGGPIDSDLALLAVVQPWPQLGDAMRHRILELTTYRRHNRPE